MDLTENCYRLTRGFPRDELFGMTGQIRRSAASIPANIAEGWGRKSTGEYIRFTKIAQGSMKELETHLILAARVELMDSGALSTLLEQTERLGRRLSLGRALGRPVSPQTADRTPLPESPDDD
ncbi:MAG TPA: four helix bundle protein [Dehalococcoidia bacterium]|nr:four helix bundle protein [Dehalococcoidia bacterium]